MFKTKRDKVRDFLKEKDWQTLQEIADGIDMGKGSTKATLVGMKKEIEEQDDKFRIIPKAAKVEAVSAVETTEQTTSNATVEQPDFNPPEQEPELQKKGLNAKLTDMEQKLDMVLGVKERKQKKARLKKFNIGKIKRFNKKKNRAVILMSNNHNAVLVKGEYIAGMIKVGENYYDGSAMFTWLWEGKQPVYFIPEWSIRPLAADEIYNKAKAEGELNNSQVITLRAMKLVEQDSEDAGKKKPNIMIFVGIAIAGIIIAWLVFGGKK